jgi:hypothetical protein
MTNEEIKAELTSCLAEQIALDERADKLTERFKVILQSVQAHVVVEIDGRLYELAKEHHTRRLVDKAHKFGGFYAEYRLVPRSPVIR